MKRLETKREVVSIKKLVPAKYNPRKITPEAPIERKGGITIRPGDDPKKALGIQ